MSRFAIIVGASSGIGAELARQLSGQGYRIGVAARRGGLVRDVAASVSPIGEAREIDLAKPEEAAMLIENWIREIGSVDLFVVAAGVGDFNFNLSWETERETIETNVLGFAAVANVAIRHFEAKGAGHLVGLSSIAAIRGSAGAPAYGASKAFVCSYLASLRHRTAQTGLPIKILDVQLGYVNTAMAKGSGLFWVAKVDEAARQISAAISTGRPHVYVTKRWRLVAWALRIMPRWMYYRL